MSQLKTILILVVCSLYCSYAAAEDCSGDGLFVVKDDCSRYYQCANGAKVFFDCADGLKFDDKSKVCVWASQLDCASKSRPTKQPVASTTKKPSPPTADCPKGDGYFVDEKNCGRFYVCSDGARHYSDCNNGLYFDTVSKTCTSKAQAKCTN